MNGYVTVYEFNNGTLAIEHERENGETYKAVFDADYDGYIDDAVDMYRSLIAGVDPIDEGWGSDEVDLSGAREILFRAGEAVYAYESRCGYAGESFVGLVKA